MNPDTTTETPVSYTVPASTIPQSVMKLNPEWLITLALCFFLGMLGVHRFYNGKIGTGILMIVTFGGLGIWAFIDFIIVLFGKFTHKNGTVISVRIPA